MNGCGPDFRPSPPRTRVVSCWWRRGGMSRAWAAPGPIRCGSGSGFGSLTSEETRNGPPPRANPDLLGHEACESALRRLFESGRMPHAVLMTGPRGIGKATLAYRFARFVLLHGATGTAAGLPPGDDGT